MILQYAGQALVYEGAKGCGEVELALLIIRLLLLSGVKSIEHFLLEFSDTLGEKKGDLFKIVLGLGM